MSPRKKLRELLARKSYAVVPGAYDTLTARLVQVAGFEAVYLTGGGFSRANGYPDLGLLTMSEVVQFVEGEHQRLARRRGPDGFLDLPGDEEEAFEE